MRDASSGPVDPRPSRVAPVSLDRVAQLLGVPAPAPATVTGVSLRSSSVRPGDVYAALPGSRTHGARFSGAAARAGAVAVLTDPTGVTEAGATGLPVLVTAEPRRALGGISALVYGHPAQRLRLLGVTGTAGKTTTTHLAAAGVTGAGLVPAVVGTNGTWVAGKPVASALTTPEAPELHALFAVMVEHGVDVCAMEVSSHALVQDRVDGVTFDVAAFLNLSHDHLDFHATMANYFAAKATLFTPERSRRAVVNLDDEHGRRLAERPGVPTATLSAAGAAADWRATRLRATAAGSRFTVCTPDRTTLAAEISVPGAFNVTNALAAIAALSEAGLPIAEVVQGVAEATAVPGRMERVDEGQAFTAVVDYAHKPEALAAVLRTLRGLVTGRLIVVLGAGGDRDRTKRPLLGRVAGKHADIVVVTDDNPRHEDAGRIRAEILAGTSVTPAEVIEVADRAEAIAWAVRSARPGDCLLIAGKGSETVQEIGGHLRPFDDRAVLVDALRTAGVPR